MTSKLGIYNGALRILNERRLSSLSESREPRHLLDDVYSDGQTEGAVKICLELGQWTFATKTVKLDYSPSVEPSFGYAYAFDRPTDLVRVAGMFSDEYCSAPLLRYSDERHFWYADNPEIYVKYVSNDLDYGADMSLWPETFVRLIEAYLAKEIAGNLTQGDNKVLLAGKAWKDAKLEARSIDAMNKPTAFLRPGTWELSRRGWSRGSRSDRR